MKRIITTAAIAALAISPLACTPSSTDVKLGLIVSLEGTGEPYGSSIRDGVTLAVEELNATGGINVDNAAMKPIVLVTKDTHSDPVRGAEMAHEILAAGVAATIGADVSDVTLAIAPHFQEAQQILLSPASSTPKLTTAGDYIYRNFPSDDLEALNVADHIFNKAGLREAAVIANQNEFGLGQKSAFIQRFRTLGGRDVGQESFPTGATTEQIAQAVQSIIDAPAVYIAGYAEETAAVASALRAAGSDAALFGTGAVLGDRLVDTGGEAVEGLMFPRPSFDPMSEVAAVENFVTAFRDKYNRIPDTYAAHGYDAVMILAQAIQEAGTDPAEIRFYLNSMNPYDGVTGSTDFDDNGDVRKYHRMYTIREGVAVPVGD
jgi:branched-chain amino acid transport system substrate-binding protein